MPWVCRGIWAAALALFAMTAVKGARGTSNSFPAFYTASRLLGSGVDPTRLYDDEWFAQEANRYSPKIHDIWTPSPPTASALFLPFSGLAIGTARTIWTAIDALLLLGTLWLVLTELAVPEPQRTIIAAVWLLAHPVWENFLLGQTHVFGLALTALAWKGFRRNRAGLLGGSLAALALIKAGGALVLLVLLIRRMARCLLIFGGVVATVGVALLPWIPLSAWVRWIEATNEQSRSLWVAAPAHQSLIGFLHHFGVADPQFNPSPPFDAPRLVAILGVIAAIGAVVLVAWMATQPDAQDEVFSAAILVSLVLIPVTRDYHYCVALLPVAVAIAQLPGRGPVWRALAVTSCALLVVPLHHNSARFSSGLISVAHYPLLLGAATLTGLMAWSARVRIAPSAY